MEKRISEKELIIPSLYLMHINKGRITTSKLIKLLTEILKPTGQDIEILNNRNDTYFSQKVRNLKSHNTLFNEGWVTYDSSGYVMTDKGQDFLMSRLSNLQYLLSADFEYSDVKTALENLGKKREMVPYEEMVEEGKRSVKEVKTYARSQKLRKVALEHFSHNGDIGCDCCGFDFKAFYGETYGKSCIEFHHIRPIFQYNGVSEKKTIEEALENLLPVCPNCHRVIHKMHISADHIQEFKAGLAQYSFVANRSFLSQKADL